MVNIISSIIAGGLTLIGVIITNLQSNRRIENQLTTSQAVTDAKLENLTQEVKKHNDYYSRVPLLELRVSTLEERLKEMKTNETSK